jgi:probable phosphoglycerate mutase
MAASSFETSRPTTRFGLIRHAATQWNLDKRIQGQRDTDLCSEGRLQAEGWRAQLEILGFDRILTSDLGRARQTADIINHNMQLPLDLDPRLREQDWGVWVGLTVAQIRAQAPEVIRQQEAAGWRFQPPRGEDRLRVKNRSLKALQGAARQWPGRNILVVGHQGVLKCLLYHLSERNFLPLQEPLFKPGYYLHWLVHDGHQLMIEKVNGVSLDGH